MRHPFAGLCAVIALVGSAPAVMAQDIGAEYTAAFQTFSIPDRDGSPEVQAQVIADTLPGLEGRWLPADTIAGDLPEFDASRIGEHCDRLSFVLRQTAPHGFVLVRTNREGTVHLNMRHDYVGGRSFQRSADENELIALLRIDPIPPVVLLHGAYYARVMLYHPSPNIMVMQAEKGNAEIYARCP